MKENSMNPAAHRRVFAGGSPLTGPVLIYMGWGPLIESEFDRLRAMEARFLADDGGIALAHDRIAKMSFPDMSRIFSLRLPEEITLPVKSQRTRGQTQALDVAWSRMAFARLYSLFAGKAKKEVEFVTAFRGALVSENWEEATRLAFSSLGGGFRTTQYYQRFLENSAQLAAGSCFVYASGVGDDLLRLSSESIEKVNQGETHILNSIARKHRVEIGWLLALFVLLFRRKKSEEIRSSLRHFSPESMRNLECLAWATIPDFEATEEWEMYVSIREGKPLNLSKPGPKPKKRERRDSGKQAPTPRPDSDLRAVDEGTELPDERAIADVPIADLAPKNNPASTPHDVPEPINHPAEEPPDDALNALLAKSRSVARRHE